MSDGISRRFFLPETKSGTEKNDEENNARIDRISKKKRKDRSKEQNKSYRVFKLT